MKVKDFIELFEKTNICCDCNVYETFKEVVGTDMTTKIKRMYR